MSKVNFDQVNLLTSEELPEVVYTSVSEFRSPTRIVRQMWRDLKASRELAWRLLVRDISARYRQTYFGLLWVFVPPVATTLIFVILNRQQVINVGQTNVPYPVFVVTGTILWQLFVDSLQMPLNVVNMNKSILSKINFPRESLIMSGIGQILFDLSIRLFILFVVYLFYQIPLTWGMLLTPVPIFMLMVLGITLGLLITPPGVLYQDVSEVLKTVIMLWFFVTPVVYSPPQSGIVALLAKLNPVTPFLMGARDLLTHGSINDPLLFGIVSALTLSVLFFVWIIYRFSMPILIERMSA